MFLLKEVNLHFKEVTLIAMRKVDKIQYGIQDTVLCLSQEIIYS